MNIAILSDSHDNTENLSKAIKILQEKHITEAIHLGDFVNPNAIRLFKDTHIHLTGIFGNNDGEVFGLTKAFQDVDGTLAGHFYETTFGDKTVGCYHGTVTELKDSLITSKKYDIVLYGHDHTAFDEVLDGVHAINPGTLHGFGKRASFVIYDTDAHTVEFIDL